MNPFHEITDPVQRARFENACWRKYCEERGVTPEGIAAGTDTLDYDGRGNAVFPPITTAYTAPIATTGASALYVVTPDIERWQGEVVAVPGYGNVTINTSGSKGRPEWAADPKWQGVLGGP